MNISNPIANAFTVIYTKNSKKSSYLKLSLHQYLMYLNISNSLNRQMSFFKNNFQKKSFADVLQNRCSSKFRKFYRKTPVLDSPFNKLFQNETPTQCFPVKFAKFWRTYFFREHLWWLLLGFLEFIVSKDSVYFVLHFLHGRFRINSPSTKIAAKYWLQ